MWDEDYRLSQQLADEALAAIGAGEPLRGRLLYHQAADRMLQALAALPANRTRTQQMMATRAITLLVDGENVVAAISLAAEWYPKLPGWLQDEVERAFQPLMSGSEHQLVIGCMVERHRQVQFCPISRGRRAD